LEGNDSNRRNIYSNLIQAYVNKANPVNWLFGFGADGTILLTHRQAHNDWLQILVDHGLVGSIVFLVFWIRAFVSRKRFANNDLKFLFSMVVIMLFVRTLFSMSINDMYISSNLILGYCLANMYSDLIEKH
jgi:O-antigen ligase